jgi:hypothetical protein
MRQICFGNPQVCNAGFIEFEAQLHKIDIYGSEKHAGFAFSFVGELG